MWRRKKIAQKITPLSVVVFVRNSAYIKCLYVCVWVRSADGRIGYTRKGIRKRISNAYDLYTESGTKKTGSSRLGKKVKSLLWLASRPRSKVAAVEADEWKITAAPLVPLCERLPLPCICARWVPIFVSGIKQWPPAICTANYSVVSIIHSSYSSENLYPNRNMVLDS